MAQEWTLEEIRQEVRNVSGRPSVNQISDSEIDDRVNDFYTQRFSQDIGVSNIEGTYTIDVTATDSGEYELPASVLRLNQPVTINGLPSNEFSFFQEEGPFFVRYPDREEYVTEPGIGIGTSDLSKVKYNDFNYQIDRYSYSTDSAEVALNGDIVPQNTYAAWTLKISVGGDVTVTPAPGNGTGYASARLALEATESSDSELSYMGYITLTREDKDYEPNVPDLDAFDITVTFTDGSFDNRSVPEAILIWQNKVFMRPKPNDIYRLTAGSIERPAELTSGVSPLDKSWGRAIAYGTAIEIMDETGEDISTQTRMYKKLTGFVNRKKQNQDGKDRLASRSF
jgi:hypothetical protein